MKVQVMSGMNIVILDLCHENYLAADYYLTTGSAADRSDIMEFRINE